MKNNDDTQLLLEIAHLYYEKNYTQSQIGKRLNISRSSISKMLSRAHELGIVEVVIHDEDINPQKELEDAVRERFHLRRVICVDNEHEQLLNGRLGVAAGSYLATEIEGKKNIAIGGGSTIYSMATNFICDLPREDVTFIPISGGLENDYQYMQAAAISEILAHETGGDFMPLYSPLYVDSYEAAQVLSQQKFIKNVLDCARNADLAIVGLGSSRTYLTWAQSLYQDQASSLQKYSDIIAGDISYNVFDEHGEPIDCEWNRCLISLKIDDISHIKEVILVAGGLNKAESIYIAITNHFADTLITDVLAAKKILAIAGE